ncbi:MAG: DNA polymerase [Staphylococcus equorum]
MLNKLPNKDSALLVYLYIAPFTLKDCETYIKNHFKHFVNFKARSFLGSMYGFHFFLKSVLDGMFNKYKNSLDNFKKENYGRPEYTFPEEYLTELIELFNNQNSEIMLNLSKIFPPINFTSEMMSLIDEVLYLFDTEVMENSDYSLKLHLYPKGSYAVDKKLFESIYYILQMNKYITNIPNPKALLIYVNSGEGQWSTLGKTLHLTDGTTFEQFMKHYLEAVFKLKNKAYPLENIDFIALNIIKPQPKQNKVRSILKLGGIREYSTIRKLKERKSSNKNLGVLDIETVLIDGTHVIYAIGYKLPNKESVIYYISDYGKSLKTSSQKIINAFLDDFLSNAKGYYIYCHNLGAFDGYLLLKHLNKKCDNVNILMDKQKKFISIDLIDYKIKFRDSLRILPASLDSLSKMFDVDIQKGFLDHEKVNKSLIYTEDFKIQAEEYLNRDLISLLSVIAKANESLLDQYYIDLSKCLSASSMAMKIYRTNFMKTSIPILPPHIDKAVRTSYRGGATEVYRCYGKNLYYYDVNSLYPAAMLNPIPYNFLGVKENIDLDNFFGFITVDVYAPESIFNPFLPYKDENTGNILYPHGKFSGTYFSEELKLARSKGYEFTLKRGYEFSKKELFKDYVNHFYDKKINSNGGERFLYKLMLNSIYGYLGRDIEQLKTEIIKKSELNNINQEYFIHNYVDLDENNFLITRDLIPSRELQQMYKIKPRYNTENPKTHSNVAISSAITSYARMIMVPVKTDIDNPPFYTDTDSIAVGKKLPNKLVGKSLGQFKDVLNGSTMSEALFLASKMYGYKVDNISKVVIAGVKPDSVSYEELIKIWRGQTVIKNKIIIIKDLTTMSIKNKTTTLNLSLNKNFLVKQPVYNNNGFIILYKPRVLT